MAGSIMKTWREQYERVGRFEDAFRLVSDTGNLSPLKPPDLVYGFFQNAYHLKDWLISDPNSGLTRSQVEGWITASQWLTLCSYVANGSKHFAARPRKRGSQRSQTTDTSLVSAHVTVDLEARAIYRGWDIESEGKIYDALEVAHHVASDWESNLRNHGLIPY